MQKITKFWYIYSDRAGIPTLVTSKALNDTAFVVVLPFCKYGFGLLSFWSFTIFYIHGKVSPQPQPHSHSPQWETNFFPLCTITAAFLLCIALHCKSLSSLLPLSLSTLFANLLFHSKVGKWVFFDCRKKYVFEYSLSHFLLFIFSLIPPLSLMIFWLVMVMIMIFIMSFILCLCYYCSLSFSNSYLIYICSFVICNKFHKFKFMVDNSLIVIDIYVRSRGCLFRFT